MKMKCSRKYVSLSDFWVSSHGRFSDFNAGAWQPGDSAIPLLVIRVVLAAVAVAVLAWSVYEAPNKYWLTFLTNWGLIFVTAMMLSGVTVSVLAVQEKTSGETGSELPWYMSMYWFLYNVGISLAFMITALYWILLYDPEESRVNPMDPPRLFWLDVATHAINSCIALLELLASRTPVKFVHLYQPLGVGLWYAAFTAIYFVAGGKDLNGFPFIYEILDWRNGKRSLVVVVASALGLIIIYTLVWGVALCRDRVSAAIFRNTSGKIENTTPETMADIV